MLGPALWNERIHQSGRDESSLTQRPADCEAGSEIHGDEVRFWCEQNTNAATAIDATAPKAADLINAATRPFTSNPS